MTQRYLAFLRGMNIGGHRVSMAELRTYFTSIGLRNVETFIASGNVIFDAPARESEAALQLRIEVQLQASLGYSVRTLLRTNTELSHIAARSPFDIAESKAAGHTIHVGFLDTPLDATVVHMLKSRETAMDAFGVHERDLYWLCRGKSSDSLVSWPEIEKLAKWHITMRNMNTVVKLTAKYCT